MLRDRFLDDRPAGAVIGSRSESGAQRLGVDAEGKLAVDHGSLRLGCPDVPGWGRHGIAYGPHARRPGAVLAVFLLNGHNASQTVAIGEAPLRTHLQRMGWRLRGEVRAALALGVGRVPALHRRLGPLLERRREHPDHYRWPPLRDNLAVGWFSTARPRRPAGDAFVMRADGPRCGILCASLGGRPVPVVEGVQNLPLYLVVALRARGAAYYVASLPGADGLGGYPDLRPVGVDVTSAAPVVYAGAHQSVLGEIGFRVASRVFGIQAAQVPEWSGWYGTAHAADRLQGSGPLGAAEVGGTWSTRTGVFRSSDGARSERGLALPLLHPPGAAGLIHVRVRAERGAGGVGLLWRAASRKRAWAVRVARAGASLLLLDGGRWSEVARDRRGRPRRRGWSSLQVLDDGRSFSVILDGRRLFGEPVRDARLRDEAGVGLLLDGPDVRARDLEVHPRRVRLPDALDLGAPWLPAEGDPRRADAFGGPARDLAGKPLTAGGSWERTLGAGRIEVTGDGSARVRATPGRPNPGRTLYTVPWDQPGFADLEVEVVPPGVRQGEGQLARGGLVLWQDPRNYLVLNDWNDDRYPGTSVSSFLVLDGQEDVYDAVWSNVGDRIQRGRAHRLRLTSDGLRYLVRLDGEPVLYRALTDVYPGAEPLRIRRVGLAVNWEFGDDTGTLFRRFVARGAAVSRPSPALSHPAAAR